MSLTPIASTGQDRTLLPWPSTCRMVVSTTVTPSMVTPLARVGDQVDASRGVIDHAVSLHRAGGDRILPAAERDGGVARAAAPVVLLVVEPAPREAVDQDVARRGGDAARAAGDLEAEPRGISAAHGPDVVLRRRRVEEPLPLLVEQRRRALEHELARRSEIVVAPEMWHSWLTSMVPSSSQWPMIPRE
jgi:hypothetical protein